MNADDVAELCEALSIKEKEGPLMPLQTVMKEDGERRLALKLVGNVEDRRHVLMGGPCSFDKALLVMAEPRERIEWFLGNMIGEVCEIDTGPSGECVGKFIRTTGSLFSVWTAGHFIRDCAVEADKEGPENYNLMYGSWLRAASPPKNFQSRQKREGDNSGPSNGRNTGPPVCMETGVKKTFMATSVDGGHKNRAITSELEKEGVDCSRKDRDFSVRIDVGRKEIPMSKTVGGVFGRESLNRADKEVTAGNQESANSLKDSSRTCVHEKSTRLTPSGKECSIMGEENQGVAMPVIVEDSGFNIENRTINIGQDSKLARMGLR
ncbi:hypothetical protein EZV62_009256 [Acer yangbiense]|uniref:DUF4283 domain-containing protein n=1 Tax=Acer yangbiense TaxID=1000413 RepID=A0A5C7IFT0_9ROSI|nr:hypothetical protein EZV62_009256 [Acer yangbiense]